MSVLDSLSPDDKIKLTAFIDDGLLTLQSVADLREGLKDVAKSLAEEYSVKPAVLMKVLRTAFKSSLEDDKSLQDTIEDILTMTGHV